MRKSFNGLAGIVRDRLQADPMSRDLFLFSNRARNRMKVLVYDESGVWVLAKRLDRGTFAWPAAADDVVKVEYREEQLALLLRGFDADTLRPRRWRRRARQSA
jgi:transposase